MSKYQQKTCAAFKQQRGISNLSVRFVYESRKTGGARGIEKKNHQNADSVEKRWVETRPSLIKFEGLNPNLNQKSAKMLDDFQRCTPPRQQALVLALM